jgi:hypothetical protein
LTAQPVNFAGLAQQLQGVVRLGDLNALLAEVVLQHAERVQGEAAE